MMATTATRVTLRRLSTTPLFAKHSRRVTVAPLSTSASSSSDRVSPEAPSKISWDSKQPIALRMRDREPENMQPFCIQTMFRNSVSKYGKDVALGVKRNGEWVTWTYEDYWHDVTRAARGFLRLGLERQNAVGIMGANSPEWFISSVAAIFAGGLSCGIYTTNSPDIVSYMSTHAPFNVMVVQDAEMLHKILDGQTMKKAFPLVKKIVLMEETEKDNLWGTHSKEEVIYWRELLEIGDSVSEGALDAVEESQFVNDACMLVYTSGTTGPPKAAMICHDNITYGSAVSMKTYGWGQEVVISYLPLSHVAAHLIDGYMTLYCGGATYCADKNALRGTLVENMKEIRPTQFLGVPRVWEKMQEKMMEVARKNSYPKKLLANWAKARATEHHRALRIRGASHKPTLGYRIAKKLIFSKIHAALGLDRATVQGLCVAGAAAMPMSTFEYFESLDIVLHELMGCTETSGPQATNRKGVLRPGTVGTTFWGVNNTILNPDANGHGELATSSRNVFMGYLWDEARTRAAFTEDLEWYRSGDIAKMYSDGFIQISGRIKELIVTGGGENIAPLPIEDNIKKELPDAVSNVMVVGDGRKYLTCLITLRVEVDPVTLAPSDRLDEGLLEWADGLGVQGLKTVADFLESYQNKALMSAIQEGIDRANAKSLSNPSKVQKFTVLPHEFSVATGELGPTLKLKRFFVDEKYEELINRMYSR